VRQTAVWYLFGCGISGGLLSLPANGLTYCKNKQKLQR